MRTRLGDVANPRERHGGVDRPLSLRELRRHTTDPPPPEDDHETATHRHPQRALPRRTVVGAPGNTLRRRKRTRRRPRCRDLPIAVAVGDDRH